MNPAVTIAAVIETAATRHTTPVDPISLLDTRISQNSHFLRARLNSVIAYHLGRNHKLSDTLIARAYKVTPNAIRYRRHAGLRLVKKSPWKETYLTLP